MCVYIRKKSVFLESKTNNVGSQTYIEIFNRGQRSLRFFSKITTIAGFRYNQLQWRLCNYTTQRAIR